MGRYLWAYYITDSRSEEFKRGNVIFLDAYYGKYLERYATYNSKTKEFLHPVKGILISRIDNNKEAMNELVKKLFFNVGVKSQQPR